MLKTMVDYDVMFYVMGVVALVGVCSKMISQLALKRLVRAAGNMNKSTHKLMKLMRAKFEHACMVSDRVQNVNAFVEKYVFEYRVLGLRLHTWQQLLRQSMWACMLLGAMGAGMYYRTYGMGETVYHYGGIGASLMVLLFLLQVTTDERYLLKNAEIYMIDYLENVCMHRYEKTCQREAQSRKAAVGQAVLAGVDSRADAGTEHFEKKEKTETEASRKMVEEPSEKVVPMEKEAEHTEEIFSRKKRKETRREIQEGQKRKHFGRKAAEEELPNRIKDRETPEEHLGDAAAMEPAGRMSSISGEADAAPKEAIIREILEEFLAQRT